MRLTTELIQGSLSYLNPLKERELDLRGHKIPSIENLGVAGPQDAIDFTDNDITTLSNFPLSPRLQTLLCARNRITHIQPTLHQSIPNLTTLIMTHNNIAELADLNSLGGFHKLTHLSVMENPVARKENCRLYLLYRCPSLRFLDYQKVKLAERKAATALFGTIEEPSEAANNVQGLKSRTFDTSAPINGTAGGKGYRVKLSDKEKKVVEKLIREAKSLQDIIRLEKDLSEGRVPAEAQALLGEEAQE